MTFSHTRPLLTIALLATAISLNARASDLSEAAKAQKSIAAKTSNAEEAERLSNALQDEAKVLSTEILRAFYLNAKSQGVAFDNLKDRPRFRNPRPGQRIEIFGLTDDGYMAIEKNCISGMCISEEPIVSVRGYGGVGLTVFFDGKEGPSRCGGGTISLKCQCRISALSDFKVISCERFFSKSARPEMIRETVNWLNQGLVRALKQKSAKP